ALCGKACEANAAGVGAEEVLLAGTVRGGEVLDLPVGRIAPDYAADLVVVDLRGLSLQPSATAHKQIVYAMRPDAIRRVLVGGEPVVEDGRLVNADEEEIRARVAALTRDWTPVERVSSPV